MVQAIQDPFGISRLVDQININRKERAQQPIRDLQTQLLRGQVQQQQLGLADLAKKREFDEGLQLELRANPGANTNLTTINYLKRNNPELAEKKIQSIFEQGGNLLKTVGGAEAVRYINENTGSDFKYKGSPQAGFHEVDTGDKVFVLNDAGETIKEFAKGTTSGSKDDIASDKAKFAKAKDIRAEIDKASKTFNDTKNAFGRVQAVTKTPSAAGDLALIFNFMKMLDPGSVVRESEFATAEQARAWMAKTDEGKHPIPAFVKQGIQKLSTGQKLLPDQRTDFLSQSSNIFKELKGRHSQTIDNYVSLGERFGLERGDIVVERGSVNSNKGENKPGEEIEVQEGSIVSNPETGESLILKSGEWVKYNG